MQASQPCRLTEVSLVGIWRASSSTWDFKDHSLSESAREYDQAHVEILFLLQLILLETVSLFFLTRVEV